MLSTKSYPPARVDSWVDSMRPSAAPSITATALACVGRSGQRQDASSHHRIAHYRPTRRRPPPATGRTFTNKGRRREMKDRLELLLPSAGSKSVGRPYSTSCQQQRQLPHASTGSDQESGSAPFMPFAAACCACDIASTRPEGLSWTRQFIDLQTIWTPDWLKKSSPRSWDWSQAL